MNNPNPAATLANHQLNQRVSALRARQDLKLPKSFKAAFDKLSKLELLRMTAHKDAPTRDAVVASTIENLDVDMAALAEVELFDAKVAVIDAAIDGQKANIEGLIYNHSGELIDEIRRVLYNPVLERVRALGEQIDPAQKPVDLQRAGRADLAQEYLAVEVMLDQMREALELRTLLFGSPVQDGSHGQRFQSGRLDTYRRPDLAVAAMEHGQSELANLLAAIEAGGDPWCPTPLEVNAWRAEYLKAAQARMDEMNRGARPPFGSIG